MKIIGGALKGRIIYMPGGIRPTSDKVREAVFEITKGIICGADFLDLYCGSGAMGIEAFSRGANRVAFVDKSSKCVFKLKENFRRLGISDLSMLDIYNKDALLALQIFAELHRSFDIVYIDPPYYKDIAKNTLIELSSYDILARNALVVLEVYKKETLPDEAGGLKRVRAMLYGDTKLEFFRK